MNAKVIFLDLFQHMKWADLQVWNKIKQSEKLMNDEKCTDLIFHIHLVQNMFLNVWLNDNLQIDRKNRSLESAEKSALMFYERLKKFIKNFDNVNLEEEKILPWAVMLKKVLGADPRNTLMHETINQAVQHSTYHRAQINKRIRELDENPPFTDFIYWAWINKPIVEFKL